jgi:hypothetical protein
MYGMSESRSLALLGNFKERRHKKKKKHTHIHTRQFLILFLHANIISPVRTAGIARAAEIHFHDGKELTSGRPRFLASGIDPASYPRGTGVLSQK